MAEYDEPISDRELDVLSCLVEGASNREIAQQLSISPNTVKVHLRNIYTKLGVSSRTEATTVALQKGLLSIPGIEVDSAEGEAAAQEPTDEAESDAAEAPVAGDPAEIAAGPPDAARSVAEGETGVEEPLAPEPADVIQAEAAPATRSRGRGPLILVSLVALVALVLAVAAASRVWLGAGSGTPTPAGSAEATASVTAPAEERELGGNWRQGLAFPQARSGMSLVSVGLNIYQIGGETDEGVVNSVLVYDSQARNWLTGRPKITPVADAAAAVLGGEIYVAGGRLENGQATAIVEAYSPLNDAWRPVVSLPQPVAGGIAISDSDALYLFGGQRQGEVLAEVYRFDPSRQEWELLPPMEQARAFAAGGLIDGQPYVVGGSDGQDALASCERFDLDTASWSDCPNMQLPRQAAAAATVLNKLYVIGGAGEGTSGLGEVFDADGGWEPIEVPTETEIASWTHLGVTNVETRIYAVGGIRQGERSDEMLIYVPLVYQFFIPAASAGGE